MIDADIAAFLDAHRVGVLATTRGDGSGRQSVLYFVRDGHRLLMSTMVDRAKAHDVERTGRASYCVVGHESPYPSVSLEGRARILREGVAAPTARLIEIITGAPPADPPSEEALASVGRVILELSVERTYGRSHF